MASFITRYPRARGNEGRWFFEEPVHQDGQTWVVSEMWGADTEQTLSALSALSPEGGVGYRRGNVGVAES